MSGFRICRRLFVLAMLLVAGVAAAGAATYEVDAIHSTVIFRAKRMGVVYVYGRFGDLKGSIELPGEDLTQGSISLVIQTASVDSGNERRDNHLRSPDFLNATQIPTMSFESSAVRKTGETSYEVTGELSLHGVKKQITVPVELVGSGEDPRSGAKLIGFEGDFTVNRSDYGMSFMVGPISEEVGVRLAIQAVSQ
jgi:polyisoprenoid-binding protein YceI